MESGKENSKAKLPMQPSDRQDYAWSLTKMGLHSLRETTRAAGISKAHHSRARVHGDRRQTLVTRAELKPFEDRVREVMAKGHQALIVSSLTEINSRIRQYAEAEIARYHRGTAMNRHVVTGCEQLQKVASTVDPVQTAVTLAALFLLSEHRPRCFVSDAGMRGAMVRQYRLPAGIARGRTYDHKRDKYVGWFKSLPRQTTEFIGQTLADAHAPWVAHVMQTDKRLRDEEQRIARDLDRAFAQENAL